MSGPDWRAWARLYEDEAEARRGAAAVEMRLEAARIYDTHLGDPRGAEAQLRAANRLSPDDPRPIHALADLHEAQGDLAEARRWLARAQTLTPAEDIDGRLALLCRLGVIAQDHLHDQEGAFAAFKEAILLAPDDLEILTRLRLALPEDDPRARLAILRRRPRPEAPEARAAILKQIARLEMQGGDAEAARLALEEALALCPTDEEALWASLALGGVGLKLEAAELSGLWRCIGALQEAHGAAWVAAGEGAPTAARRALAYHAEAQGAWAEAVALWPREAHEDEWRWALAMERAGDVEAARGALAERVALEPGDEIAEASLRRLDPIFEQLRAGGAYAADAAEAEGDLDAALRLTTTPQARARRLALRGDWVGAAAALESGDPLVWAEARLRAGDEDGAVALLRAHVEALSPTRRRLLLTLAQARGDVALERDLLAREALNAEGAYRAALLLRRAALEGSDVEGWARRVALLREVLALTPGARAAHRALGRLYFEAGDVAALADLYQEELRRAALSEAERADRLRRLAELYEYRLDRPAAASECYEALLHAAPLTAIEGLERIYERTARPQALAAVLKRRAAAASAPKEAAWAYLRYGELLHERVEDHAAAAEAYRHALSLDPTLRPAAMALERITLRGGGDPAAFYEEALAQPTPFEDAQTLRHKRDLCLGTPGAASEGALGRWAVLRRAYDLGDWPTAAAALRAEAEAGAEAERADLNALAFRLMRGLPQAAAFIEGLGEAAGLEARLSLDVEGVAAPWAALAAAAEGAPLRGLAAWRAGLERAALEDWEGAEIAYRAALEVSPDALAPLIGLSRLPARAAARAEALAQLSEAAQSPALRAYAEASRGYLLAPHDPASALAAFTLAAQLDPHAVEPARRALALDPPDPETRRALLLRCLSAPCTPKEALDWLRQLYPLQTGEAALQTLRRLATLDDQDQAVKARLAAALIEAGEIEEGEGLLDEIEASVDIEALDLEGLIALGRLLAPTRAEAAQRLLRRAVSLLDEEGLALEALGEVALARGDARGAEAAYHRMERVVEAPARRAAARIGRARALSALGQEEEARALIKAALKWAAVERDEALRVLLESAKLSRDADEA